MYDHQFYVVMAHAKIDCDCVQVEFNKASYDKGFWAKPKNYKCSKENCSKLTS